MAKKQLFRFDFTNREAMEGVGKEVLAQLKQGMTLKEATGVSDETLEEIYCLAHGFYNQGKYKESLGLFQFLAGASPTTFKFVYGLAATCHQMEAYDDAVNGFYIAWNLDPLNPLPLYYAADALLKLNERAEAIEFLEATIEACDNRAEYENLKEKCKLIKKSLK